jgi:hypothetical protein
MATPRNRAHEFFDTHVAPAVNEWRAAPTDLRLAMIAAVALNQMADHFWHGFQAVDPSRVFNTLNPKAFRAGLASRNPHFALVRDVADAHKHVKLDRPIRAITSAGQTTVGATGYGEGGFGTGPYGGGPSVVINLDSGQKQHLSTAVTEVVQFWTSMLL